ncbi:hypothetical protein GCM10009839_67020 [Catenulispora yoronensis]|uniref:DUF2218 domain-containing protein n=1 Tax=Catenulispora yoronensis TaxID=450799 RepID=A0ABN2V4J2_9ACTN
MPVVRATVHTPRAARYLAQLLSHTRHLDTGGMHRRGNHAGPATAHTASIVETTAGDAEATDESAAECTTGRVTLGGASCDLTAGPTALTLVVTADDLDQLRSLQASVTRTLERIGRRDRLEVAWE